MSVRKPREISLEQWPVWYLLGNQPDVMKELGCEQIPYFLDGFGWRVFAQADFRQPFGSAIGRIHVIRPGDEQRGRRFDWEYYRVNSTNTLQAYGPQKDVPYHHLTEELFEQYFRSAEPLQV